MGASCKPKVGDLHFLGREQGTGEFKLSGRRLKDDILIQSYGPVDGLQTMFGVDAGIIFIFFMNDGHDDDKTARCGYVLCFSRVGNDHQTK